jgi:ankyrin repeat protein/UDP-2,3-diacylglucosamine pyrophosphatase LpxH
MNRLLCILSLFFFIILMTVSGYPHAIHEAARKGNLTALKALIEKEPQLANAVDENGITPLHLAASGGFIPGIEFLSAHGATIDARDIYANTPLHMAACNGKAEPIALLKKLGADVNAKTESGATPLHISATRETSELLISLGADIESLDRQGWTPLHYATSIGSMDLVALLLDHHADINRLDRSGCSPLHCAAETGNLSLTEILIAAGATVDQGDERGWTPLFRAISNQSTKEAELLISKGAGVDAKDKDGLTPLHVSAKDGLQEMAELLIARKARVNQKDLQGMTPLHYAVSAWQLPLCRVLLSHGADASIKDARERTPLHIASSEGSLEICRLLLEHGVSLNECDESGRTALSGAIFRNHQEVAEYLLWSGASPAIKDKDGCTSIDYIMKKQGSEKEITTALHWASANGHMRIAKELIESGVSINMRGDDGYTPLDWALRNSQKEMAEFLAERGGKRTPLSRGGLSHNVIVISDTHIGAEKSAKKDLCEFFKYLRYNPPSRLVLNGDLVEFWLIEKERGYSNARDFIQQYIVPLMEQGTQVDYVIGNHDYIIHNDIAELYKTGGAQAVEKIYSRLGLKGKSAQFHFWYPYYVLKMGGGKQKEKQILIMHGDTVDLIWAFRNIGKLNLKATPVLGMEDAKFRDLLHSIQMKDVYTLYTWISQYQRKDSLAKADETFNRIPVNVKVSLFFDFILSPLPQSILKRAHVTITRNPMMLGVIPLHHKELNDFFIDTIKLGFDKMGKRSLDSVTERWFDDMFHQESWWKYYRNDDLNRPDLNALSSLVIGHVHRVGTSDLAVGNRKIRMLSDGGWYHGTSNDSGTFIEFEEDNTALIKRFKPPASFDIVETIKN